MEWRRLGCLLGNIEWVITKMKSETAGFDYFVAMKAGYEYKFVILWSVSKHVHIW